MSDAEPEVPAKTPRRQRGKRTRAALVDAAQLVFERDGYLDARVADIAAAAGVAHGSFYTYFDSKEDVFRELVEAAILEVAAAIDAREDGLAPADRIRAGNRRYIDAYARHAGLLGLIEQVGTLSQFHTMRRELRGRFVARVEAVIGEYRAHGEVQVEPMDDHVVSHALVGMMDSFAYNWFVLGDSFKREVALENLDAIWMRTLGIRAAGEPPAEPARGRPARGGGARDKPARGSARGRGPARRKGS